MANHKYFDRICIIISVVTILIALVYSYLGPTLGVTQSPADLSYTTKLFDSSTVHTINIEISEADWNNIQSDAAAKDYQQCAVTIDGETIQNVGIRAKGNSSLSGVSSSDSERYSFKVEFDHYNDGENYHGLDKLNLNNIISDNTYLKDYLCYDMMDYMGIAAPLTSFTRISVNGEYFGLYLAVEGIEDAFAQRNYGSDSGNIYKPDSMENNANAAGNTTTATTDTTQKANIAKMPDTTTQATATTPTTAATPMSETTKISNTGGGMGGTSSTDVALVYSDDQISSYTNIFKNAITDVTTADKNTLIASIKQLNEGENLDEVVDVNEVLKYFVVHSFVDNFDSYTGSMMHNYYLREVNGQLSVIPWDYNLAFTNFSGGGGGKNDQTTSTGTVAVATTLVNFPIDTPVSGTTMESRPLLNALFSNEEYLKLYHQYYQEFLTGYFDSGHYTEVIDKAASLIASSVETDPTAFCSYQEYQDGVAVLKEFCAMRANSISGQLDGTIPSTTTGQAEQPTALIDASSLDVTAMGSNTVGGGMTKQNSTTDTTSTENTTSTQATTTAGQPPAMNAAGNGTTGPPSGGGNGGQPPTMNTSGTGANGSPTQGSTADGTASTAADNPADTSTTNTTADAAGQAPDMADRASQMNGQGNSTSLLSQNLPAIILIGSSLLLLGAGLLATKLYKRKI